MITKFFSSIYKFLIAWSEAIHEYRTSQASRTYHY